MTLALLFVYLAVSAAGYLLTWLNIRHLRLHGNSVPAGFEGYLDPATLSKTAAYTAAKSRVGLAESFVGDILLLIFLFAGVIGPYDLWIASLTESFILHGVLFFLFLALTQGLVDIPFSLYRNFSLENRYGFNTTTPRLWITDLIKSAGIGTLLITLLTAGIFGIVLLSPRLWWLWVWVFLAVVTLFMQYLSPYVIEPIFNRYEPIRSAELEGNIRDLMGKAGIEVGKVLQVDASRRSRHTNAYFAGIGRVKRIVLFDTLLETLDNQEILAVLAHEAGHWKKRHILKRILTSEAVALVSCYGAYYLINSGYLPSLLGLAAASFAAQLVILGFIMSLAATVLTPLTTLISRKHEREADQYAVRLSGMPDSLASALVKMSRDNLANLHPHPLYATVYYSHPPVVERVRWLMAEQ